MHHPIVKPPRPLLLLIFFSTWVLGVHAACGERAGSVHEDERMSSAMDMARQTHDAARDEATLDLSFTEEGQDAGAPGQPDLANEEMGRQSGEGDAGVGPTEEPPRCDGDVHCIDTFPARVSGSTSTSVRATHDRYACAPDTDEGGPEVLYRVLLDRPGFLAARLEGLPAGVDVDVHLLLDGEDPNSCLDRGHFTAGGALQPGEYWLVVDSWVNEDGQSLDGAFSLSVHLNTPESLVAHGVAAPLAKDALNAFASAWAMEQSKRFEYTLTDFSIHSGLPRAWVLDLATDTLLFHTTIGHGIGSIPDGEDRGISSRFSNEPGSHTSSLGMMLAAEPYVGDYGYSMRLDGLEPGFNDNARRRDIVVHPDERNRPEVTLQQGYLTPSRGCPTLEPDLSRALIDTIKEGSLMFYWYPDQVWRSGSKFLN